ncbi:beta-galactosidase [Trifolium repens]|nr:beta-galactosidase [Trifolium repens]
MALKEVKGNIHMVVRVVGLQGEDLGLSSGSVGQWNSQSILPTNQPLTWYKTNFVAPSGSNPIAIDFTGMEKCEAWVNGQSTGRYWPKYVASNSGCTESCNYRETYSANKCLKNCGKPSQTLYHVPQSVCSHVSESHPPPVDTWNSDTDSVRKLGPVLSLECPHPNQVISSIKFASFGTPQGTCGNFNHGQCSSNMALSIVHKACIGSSSCSIGSLHDVEKRDGVWYLSSPPIIGIATPLFTSFVFFFSNRSYPYVHLKQTGNCDSNTDCIICSLHNHFSFVGISLPFSVTVARNGY